MTEIVSNLITCSGTKAHVLLILTMAKKREKHWEEVTEDKGAQGQFFSACSCQNQRIVTEPTRLI